MAARIILVGCGNMGHAMLSGWIAAGMLAAGDVAVVEPDDALRGRAAGLGVVTFPSGKAVPKSFETDYVIFAVKPQVMGEVVPGYKRFANKKSTFLSIAAGIGTGKLEDMLGYGTPIMRCMPNTPAAIGKGMMVVFSNRWVSDEPRAFIERLLQSSGKVASIDDESLMDAVTAVSGSGPAYVFHFIECLTDAACDAGLPLEAAKLLAMQTVLGATALAAASDFSPATLREQVTSPKGTTAAALSVLMGENGLKKLMSDAVEAARARSVELGR